MAEADEAVACEEAVVESKSPAVECEDVDDGTVMVTEADRSGRVFDVTQPSTVKTMAAPDTPPESPAPSPFGSPGRERRERAWNIPCSRARVHDLALANALADRAAGRCQPVIRNPAPAPANTVKVVKFREPGGALPNRPKPEFSLSTMKFRNEGVIPAETEELKRACAELRLWREWCAREGDYLEATIAAEQYEMMQYELQEAAVRERRMGVLRTRVRYHRNVETALASVVGDWRTDLDQLERTREEKERELIGQHDQELASYDAKVPHETAPRFAKRSASLSAQVRREYQLALAGRYAEAAQARAKRVLQEREETHRAANRTWEEWLARRKTILLRQDQQESVAQARTLTRRNHLVALKERRVKGYLTRLERLEDRIQQDCEALGVREEDIVVLPEDNVASRGGSQRSLR